MKQFETVAQMKLARLTAGQTVTTKGYYAAGDGGGATYLVAASQTVDGFGDHALANGNVALLQSEKVILKQFGVTFDGVTSDSNAWNAALAKGGELYGSSGSTILESQLVIKSNTTLNLPEDCIMRRAWAGTQGTRPDNATIKNENALLNAQISIDPGPAVITTWDNDISIIGGKWGHKDDDSATYRGTHIGLIGVRRGVLDTYFQTQRAEWCTTLWLDDYDIPRMRVYVAEGGADVSNDGLHVIGGNCRIGTVKGNCDDDLVAIGSNFNIPIGAVTIDTIRCDNTNATPLKVYSIRAGATAGFTAPTSPVQSVIVNNIVGRCANVRTGYLDILIDGHTNYDLIESVIINNIDLEYLGTHDAVNTISIDITGGKYINLGNVRLTGTPTRDIVQASNVGELIIGDFVAPKPSKASQQVFDLDTIDRFYIKSGDVSANTQAVFKLDDVAEYSLGAVTARGVSNGLAGAVIQGSSSGTISEGFTVKKAAGATTSKGVRVDTGATSSKLSISNGVDLSDVATQVELTVVPTDTLIDKWVGQSNVNIQSLSATTVFNMSDGHIHQLSTTGADRNFNPTSSNWPNGWYVTINNVDPTFDITFDAIGIARVVLAGTSARFYYDLVNDLWRES